MSMERKIRELEDRVNELETQVMLQEIKYRVLVQAIQRLVGKVYNGRGEE